MGASVQPQTYSPDNPFAPKGPQPTAYSPDNPFAPHAAAHSTDNPYGAKVAPSAPMRMAPVVVNAEAPVAAASPLRMPPVVVNASAPARAPLLGMAPAVVQAPPEPANDQLLRVPGALVTPETNAGAGDTGVTDASRVYEKNGHLVVDTGNPDAGGHVPTHRIDQPTNRQPGETWEEYEQRVLARKSFSPDTAAIRDVKTLDPDVQQGAQSLIAAAKQAGHQLSVGETQRTQERQEMLFQKGRSKPGEPVTWTLTSDHTPGRALDFVVNGDTTGKDPGYQWLQENAPKYGFNVLGSMDPGHVSAPTPATPAIASSRPALLPLPDLRASRDVTQTRDTSVPAVPQSLLERAALGLVGTVADPIGTVKGMAKAATTANRAAAENEAAANVAAAGGDPSVVERTVTPQQARDAAIQTAALLALPLGGEVEAAAGRVMAPAIGSRAAGLLARTGTSAGYGAALNPEDPAVGALAGGAFGVASDVLSPARAPARRFITRNPDQMLSDETSPRAPTATGRVTEPPPLPNEPDFTVEQNAPSTYSPDNPFAPTTAQDATEAPRAPSVERSPVAATATERGAAPITPEPTAPAPKPKAGKVNYGTMETPDLIDQLRTEQQTLERWSNNGARAPWVRETPEGDVLSGGSLSGGISEKQMGFTTARIDKIEAELKTRGLSDDEIASQRLDAAEPGLEREGMQNEADFAGAGTSFPARAVNARGGAAPRPKAAPQPAPAAPQQPPNAAAPVTPKEPTAFEEVRGAIVPASASPEAGHSARIVRAGLGEFAHNFEEARHQWKPLSKIFRQIGPQKSLEAYDRAELGKHTSAREDKALKVIQDKLRSVANEIHALGPGHLDNFIDNYLAHIYDDSTKAKAVLQALGRRPFEGSRSFKKQRTIPTLKDAMAKGLKPKTWNPVDLNLLKLREMYKYLAAQKIVAEHKAVGLYRYVSSFEKAPEGYDRVNDHVAMVYGPPHIVIKEAYDALVRQKLDDIIGNLAGLTHERAASIGKRGALGFATSTGDFMATKFGGPDGVIMHELGHILDARYGLYAQLSAGKGAKELEALAALRHEGQQPSPKFEKYVQEKEEQTANAVHALLYAPEKMAAVAPTVKARLTKILGSRPELKPLLDIKPSLVLATGETTQAVGGLVIRGQYWAQKDVARILNNYLSPGLRGRSKVYDRMAGVGAMLNQAQLGLSGYHALFTSVDATVSQGAVALQNIVAGRLGKGARQLAELPIAPATNFLRGRKLLKAYLDTPNAPPAMKKYVQALIDGGGRVKMDDFYKSGAIQKMLDAFGEALQGAAAPAPTGVRRLGQRATAGTKGAAYAVPALFELLAKPIMEVLVPAQKLGVFFNLAEHEIATLPKGHSIDDERKAQQRAWQSVDNRLGQVVYDNLFWNRTGKDLAHLTIRSVGWNYGSIAELGGGAVDIGRIVNDALHGKQPNFTPRAAYLIMLPIIVGLIDALIQYLRTKDAPGYKKGKWLGEQAMLKDLFYPRTGRQDSDGNDERESIPSYMKDVAAYSMHPFQTLINKLHPEMATVAAMAQNKDFFGNEIHNPDDPFWKRRAQDLKYAKDQFIPLGVRNAAEAVRREGPFKGGVADYAKAVASHPKQLIGVTPAPREIDRTPAQNKLQEYLARKGHTSLTPEEKEAGDERRVKRSELLTLPGAERRTEVRSMIKSKEVTARQGTSLLTRAGEHPLVSKFKQLDADEALKVWALADAREKELWRKPLQIKMANAGRRAEIPADARKAQ